MNKSCRYRISGKELHPKSTTSSTVDCHDTTRMRSSWDTVFLLGYAVDSCKPLDLFCRGTIMRIQKWVKNKTKKLRFIKDLSCDLVWTYLVETTRLQMTIFKHSRLPINQLTRNICFGYLLLTTTNRSQMKSTILNIASQLRPQYFESYWRIEKVPYRKISASESTQLCTSFNTERLKTLHDQAWNRKSPGIFQSRTHHRTNIFLSHRDNRGRFNTKFPRAGNEAIQWSIYERTPTHITMVGY